VEIAIILVLGLIIGSFLNVCIYRIPRKLSIIKPFSFCPTCKNTLKPWYNIPLLSYLFLIGRCAYCGDKISLRYPIVEGINGFLYVLSYLYFGLEITLPIVLFFLSSLIVISFIDMEFQIIPDILSFSLIVSGLVVSVLPHNNYNLVTNLKDSILGILVGGGVLLIVAIVSKGGMGGGDIKLNAGVGAFLGWQSSILTLFIGSFFGAIVGLVILKKTGNRKIPFGPFISIGAIVSLFLGKDILRFYLG
jgi:leader peptidase (prepilin peptidase)/N-methyltransferase